MARGDLKARVAFCPTFPFLLSGLRAVGPALTVSPPLSALVRTPLRIIPCIVPFVLTVVGDFFFRCLFFLPLSFLHVCFLSLLLQGARRVGLS